MILWHLATSLFGFRWVFRDPEADQRWLLAGAVAPDILDIPVGTLIWVTTFSSGEIFAHSLAVTMMVGVAVLVFTDRRSRARSNLMVMMAGWLIHLVADGIWLEPRVLWWPFAGWSFPAQPLPFWPEALARAGADPWRWLAEGAGLVYLGVLWHKTGLGLQEARGVFFRRGRLS